MGRRKARGFALFMACAMMLIVYFWSLVSDARFKNNEAERAYQEITGIISSAGRFKGYRRFKRPNVDCDVKRLVYDQIILDNQYNSLKIMISDQDPKCTYLNKNRPFLSSNLTLIAK